MKRVAQLLVVSLCAALAGLFGWVAVQRDSGGWFLAALLLVFLAALATDNL